MSKKIHSEILALLHKMRQAELTDSEKVRLKSLCEDDPFLTDAIEGLNLLSREERIARIGSIEHSLKALLEKHKVKRPVLIVLRRAAAVAVIIIGIWAVWQAFPNNESGLAMRQNERIASNGNEENVPRKEDSETMSSVEKNLRIAANKMTREFEKGDETSLTENNAKEKATQNKLSHEDETTIHSSTTTDDVGRSGSSHSVAAAPVQESVSAYSETVKNSNDQLKEGAKIDELAARDNGSLEKEMASNNNNDQDAISQPAPNDLNQNRSRIDPILKENGRAVGQDMAVNIPAKKGQDNSGTKQVSAFIPEVPTTVENRIITGSVRDDLGEPLIGANIVIQGMNIGTVTDFDGNYTLEIPVGVDSTQPIILIAEYTGYAPQNVLFEGRETNDIVMQEGVELGEVAIVGMSSKRNRKTRNGEERSISSDSLAPKMKKSKNQGPRQVSYALAIPIQGWKSYYKYVRKNISTPEQAKQAQIEGTVMLEFDLKSDGTPHNFRITQSLGYGCDEEAIRLVGDGPKWDVENAQVPIGGLSIDF